MVRPSQRKEMAQRVVTDRCISIRLACQAFGISETCYRYQAKLSGDNALIADWLFRLTTTNRNWEFGLCYLYLRNVKGFVYNHKRVYRIYRELELNLRIKAQETAEARATGCVSRTASNQRHVVHGFHA